jgi:hypothetical protein
LLPNSKEVAGSSAYRFHYGNIRTQRSLKVAVGDTARSNLNRHECSLWVESGHKRLRPIACVFQLLRSLLLRDSFPVSKIQASLESGAELAENEDSGARASCFGS